MLGYQTGNFIKDLTGGPVVGNLSNPIGEFMTFANGIKFDLTRILPGTGLAGGCVAASLEAPGYTCTPVGSPFTLQNSPLGTNGKVNSASVFFNVELLGYTGLSSTGNSNYTGAFSTQTADMNIAQILSAISIPGGSVVASYSANFNGTPNNPIPEPATLGTLGIGLAAIVLGGIRRKARSVK